MTKENAPNPLLNSVDRPDPIERIGPIRGWQAARLAELWQYREILYFLTWRDIKVRYKQTVIGVAWAIIQPLFMGLVLALFFGRLARLPSDGVPYVLFEYAGLLPWQLFSHAATESSNSLVLNERLITKVYFPRLLVPLSTVLAGVVDFVFAFVVFIALMLFYKAAIPWRILVVPLFLGIVLLTALAVGLWLSALNVRYRDVRYTLAFLVQFWMFATPVAYSAQLVPEKWRVPYGLNPMVGAVEGFRWALLGTGTLSWPMLATSMLIVFLLLIGGLYYFRRMEASFSDVI